MMDDRPAEPRPPQDSAPAETTLGVEALAATSSGASGAGAAGPRRFCKRCGGPLADESSECPRCRPPAPAPGQIARPTGRKATAVAALALYFLVLGTTLVSIAAGWDGAASALAVAGADAAIVIVWCLIYRGAIVEGLRVFPRWSWWLGSAALGVATFLLATLAVEGLVKAFDADELSVTEDFVEAGHGLWVIVLALCVQPALIEELAFRGIVLGGMQSILAGREAVVVSALLFMTIHLIVLNFPHLFVLGLVLGYLRVRTGSLYPGMVLHFTHNALCVASELWRAP
jgi:hypothetical protein